ncbi:MAG: septum formation initiator family protein [Bacteroidales bacterium]|nr:septum formation initiator family protein [Bacteroidales bacterium]
MKGIHKVILFFQALPSKKYFRFLKNKYILTLILFFLWLLFFDQNNLLERRKLNREYDRLLQEREFYMKKIEEDRKQIQELKTDNENLEKFAREQYLMKKDNEDIFIIVEED